MSDVDRLTPADPKDLADALAFALRYSWRKRVNDAVEMMVAIVTKRLVEHLRALRLGRHEKADDRLRRRDWPRS